MATFDPNTEYQWKLDEVIEFSGRDFHTIHAAMQQFITSNMDVPTILKLTQAYAVVTAKLAEYVEKGIIVPSEKINKEVQDQSA